ncbi:MAG: ACT domain-containing protein [Amylibacter sp.]|nr:ACT domain-containing protein [Amylibacter sp.]
MPEVAKTAYDMISGMAPELRPGSFVFVTTNDPALVASFSAKAVSTFKEDEGISMIIPVDLAEKSMLNVDHPMRCITLNVFSSLEGVGLTAAVATALGDHDIPCNMVAAFHHDHVFVPSEMCDQAMKVLISLQNGAPKGM